MELLLEKDFSRKDEILKWIEKTHASTNISFTNINNVKVMIPLGFSKKISSSGQAEAHLWTEFMARMALTYLAVFKRSDLFRQLIESLILLQQPNGFFPYAVRFNGYKEPPAWPSGSDQGIFNYPFSSLAATVEFLFAAECKKYSFEKFA